MMSACYGGGGGGDGGFALGRGGGGGGGGAGVNTGEIGEYAFILAEVEGTLDEVGLSLLCERSTPRPSLVFFGEFSLMRCWDA